MKRRDFLNVLTSLTFSQVWAPRVFSRSHKMVFHEASSRGVADHGWLNSHHTFSFANYYNPERMGFGVLRVINDDVVTPSMGFGTHPHNNMEIISVPLKGSLKHKDTMGNETVIAHGEVQAMTAGTGIMHSEYNNSDEEDVNFLQIWVLPKKMNVKPGYSQKRFDPAERENKLQLVVSPDGRNDSVQINQDAFFHLVDLSSGKNLTYNKIQKDNGLYILNLDGEVEVDNKTLAKRDGVGIENFDSVVLKANSDSKLLLMEVPMEQA